MFGRFMNTSLIKKCFDNICMFNIALCGRKEVCVSMYIEQMLNLFVSSPPFLYPLKTSENLMVFGCFQGVEKWYIGEKWNLKDISAALDIENLINYVATLKIKRKITTLKCWTYYAGSNSKNQILNIKVIKQVLWESRFFNAQKMKRG